MKKDSHRRTLIKTFSWRFIATGTTIVAAYIVTGEIALALGIGGIEATAKLLFYYLHERAWENVRWGQVHDSEKVKKYQKGIHGLVSKNS